MKRLGNAANSVTRKLQRIKNSQEFNEKIRALTAEKAAADKELREVKQRLKESEAARECLNVDAV